MSVRLRDVDSRHESQRILARALIGDALGNSFVEAAVILAEHRAALSVRLLDELQGFVLARLAGSLVLQSVLDK